MSKIEVKQITTVHKLLRNYEICEQGHWHFYIWEEA